MREQLIKFLEQRFGSLDNFIESDLKVEKCEFCNDEMLLENAKIVGDDECFEINEFYQYVLHNDKIYKAYFDTQDSEGTELPVDEIDLDCAYKIEDITNEVLDYLDDTE